MKANLSEGKERDPVFPFPRVRDQLQPYRHRSPVIVALEPKPEPERLQWWEAAHQPVAESGATLILIAPATVTSDRVICFGDPRLLPSALESPEVWILDAYLEPRACLDASRLDPGLPGRMLAWVEGIQHECPE